MYTPDVSYMVQHMQAQARQLRMYEYHGYIYIYLHLYVVTYPPILPFNPLSTGPMLAASFLIGGACSLAADCLWWPFAIAETFWECIFPKCYGLRIASKCYGDMIGLC